MSKLTPGDRVSVDAGLGITKTGNVQRITESTVYVKHYNGAVVGYKTQHVTKVLAEQVAVQPRGVGLASEFAAFAMVMEKKLTPAELKKREEVAKAIERENPGMDMSKKMAIATATAKKVAEDTEQIDELKSSTLKRYIDKAEDSYAKTNDPKVKAKRDAGLDRADDKLERKANDRNPFKEDMHYCAKHVFSERFGEGLVVEGSHAEPTEEGLIEWYDVDFGGTVRRVMTEKVKVMHAEYHMNHKKKMKEEEEVEEAASHQASTTMKHVKGATAGEKKAAKDIKPGIAGYRDRIAMLKSAQADGRLKEGVMDTVKKVVKKVGDVLGHGDDDEMRKDLQKKMGIPQTGKPGMAKQNEAKQHTVPKTAKEKDLAAIAHPKDKITHADVLTGRGVKKEEAEINEAETGNLPGQRTHIMNKDVRHPEHGIISNGTVLRHTGGSNFEVRAGRAKGKIVNIPKEHVNKLDEEVELDEAMISYSDFQDKIKSHQKAGNQIKDDKYDKKKASYTVIDQEGTAKKITHTDSGVSQQHLGSVKRDDDESSETKSTEKRGRGRPAGSKSGARN